MPQRSESLVAVFRSGQTPELIYRCCLKQSTKARKTAFASNCKKRTYCGSVMALDDRVDTSGLYFRPLLPVYRTRVTASCNSLLPSCGQSASPKPGWGACPVWYKSSRARRQSVTQKVSASTKKLTFPWLDPCVRTIQRIQNHCEQPLMLIS